jgi:hypothetical protein
MNCDAAAVSSRVREFLVAGKLLETHGQ